MKENEADLVVKVLKTHLSIYRGLKYALDNWTKKTHQKDRQTYWQIDSIKRFLANQISDIVGFISSSKKEGYLTRHIEFSAVKAILVVTRRVYYRVTLCDITAFFYYCIVVASVIHQLIRLYFFFLFFAVPGSPRGLSLHVQNQSFILLQWNPPEHINGIITGYQVTAQKLPASTTAITGYTNDSSTEISFHHLDPRAKYEISILAVNRIGKGSPVVSTFDLTAG